MPIICQTNGSNGRQTLRSYDKTNLTKDWVNLKYIDFDDLYDDIDIDDLMTRSLAANIFDSVLFFFSFLLFLLVGLQIKNTNQVCIDSLDSRVERWDVRRVVLYF